MIRRLRSFLKRPRRAAEEKEFFDEWDRQGWGPAPSEGPRLALRSDEIEVACDALWHIKLNSGMTTQQQALWDRLQAVRHGHYGGTGSIALRPAESGGLIQALDACADRDGLNADQQALRDRLKS